MDWNTFHVIVSSIVLVIVLRDFHQVFFKKQTLSKATTLWYMLMAALYFVEVIVKNT